MYLPPNKEKLRQAVAASRLTFEKDDAGGNAIVIHDYAKAGDELRLVLNTSTLQIQHIFRENLLRQAQGHIDRGGRLCIASRWYTLFEPDLRQHPFEKAVAFHSEL
jgi:hypothetical protein